MLKKSNGGVMGLEGKSAADFSKSFGKVARSMSTVVVAANGAEAGEMVSSLLSKDSKSPLASLIDVITIVTQNEKILGAAPNKANDQVMNKVAEYVMDNQISGGKLNRLASMAAQAPGAATAITPKGNVPPNDRSNGVV